jgi:hypothetical protein
MVKCHDNILDTAKEWMYKWYNIILMQAIADSGINEK